MALNRKVRLPDLPIFRKYSLALRQEFARPEDILQALDESRRQIRAISGQEAQPGGPDFSRNRPAARLRSSQKGGQMPGEVTEAVPAEGYAPAQREPSDASKPAKSDASKRVRRKVASRKKTGTEQAAPKPEPVRQKGRKKEEDPPATEEEREFWGEERPSGRGRRGKSSAGTDGLGGVGIVRIGAEGKPVARGKGSADERR